MKKLVILVFFGLLLSCATTPRKIDIGGFENGDLIFVEAKQENLSGAINRVTQKSKTEKFDHIGLVEVSKDGVFVLHASPKKGSNKEKLLDFYTENLQHNQKMIVYRLRSDYKSSIPSAIYKANQMLGKPYNWSYILDENSYYCSDFIERAFRENEIFEHIPMNFKNPETQKIDDFWVEFYAKLSSEVPQDKPGTNPNQLAGSKKLERIGVFNIKNVN